MTTWTDEEMQEILEDEDFDISGIYVLSEKVSDPDVTEIEEPLSVGLERAVREALLKYKRAGVPAVIQRDGKIIYIQPEDIEETTN